MFAFNIGALITEFSGPLWNRYSRNPRNKLRRVSNKLGLTGPSNHYIIDTCPNDKLSEACTDDVGRPKNPSPSIEIFGNPKPWPETLIP